MSGCEMNFYTISLNGTQHAKCDMLKHCKQTKAIFSRFLYFGMHNVLNDTINNAVFLSSLANCDAQENRINEW